MLNIIFLFFYEGVEGDYIARDKITATNMSKVDKFDKTTNIGGKQRQFLV